MNSAILIVGATSAIARALSRKLAQFGHPVYLAARDEEELVRIGNDLSVRYQIDIKHSTFDITNIESHKKLLDEVEKMPGGLGGIVIASGILGDENIQNDMTLAARVMEVNFSAPALLLESCAQKMASRNHGFIVGITSVAGDRGRQSNYIYGAAKGGFALYLQGLRNRLYTHNVHVMTVKPGFVDTAMTFGLPGMFLVASPDDVADDIARALNRKQDILYTPRFWWAIMFIIKSIPERIFKRLRL